jgi:hypothetical protein
VTSQEVLRHLWYSAGKTRPVRDRSCSAVRCLLWTMRFCISGELVCLCYVHLCEFNWCLLGVVTEGVCLGCRRGDGLR